MCEINGLSTSHCNLEQLPTAESASSGTGPLPPELMDQIEDVLADRGALDAAPADAGAPACRAEELDSFAARRAEEYLRGAVDLGARTKEAPAPAEKNIDFTDEGEVLVAERTAPDAARAARGRAALDDTVAHANAAANRAAGYAHSEVGAAVANGIHTTDIAVTGAEMAGAHLSAFATPVGGLLGLGATLYEIGHSNHVAAATNTRRDYVRAYADAAADALAGREFDPSRYGDAARASVARKAYERVAAMSPEERQELKDGLAMLKKHETGMAAQKFFTRDAYKDGVVGGWEYHRAATE